METIAMGAQLGFLTPTFVLIFPPTIDICSNFAALARVAKLVAVVAASGSEQSYLHLQVPSCDLLWHFWSTEGQKQSVGGDLLCIPFHRQSADLSTTPCSFSSLFISTSDISDNSRQRMTPRDEFSDL